MPKSVEIAKETSAADLSTEVENEITVATPKSNLAAVPKVARDDARGNLELKKVENDVLIHIFQTIDKDKNGTLEKREILKGLRNPSVVRSIEGSGSKRLLLFLKPSSFEETFLSITTERPGHITVDEFKRFALTTESLAQPNATLHSSTNTVAQELNEAAPRETSEDEILAVEIPIEDTRGDERVPLEATHFEETLAVEIPLEDTRNRDDTMESTFSRNNVWDKILDEESGAYYYQNKETLETSWEAPAGYLEEASNEPSSVKEGETQNNETPAQKEVLWEKILDEESGSYYYQNSKTFETSWEVPNGYDGM